MAVNLRLDWCSHEAAKYAVEHWHYSRSMPPPPVVKVGVWEDSVFIGCVLFSRGNTTNLGTAYNLEMTEVCELSRVALNEHKSPVSKIVAIAIKMLSKKDKGLRLIVSFADPYQQHVGAIYQAGNWIYSGTSSAGVKFVKDGVEYHSRQVSASGINIQFGNLRRVPKISECERIKLPPKHRYLMPLDDEMREQIKPLAKPYPKRARADVETGGASSIETGGANPTRALYPEMQDG